MSLLCLRRTTIRHVVIVYLGPGSRFEIVAVEVLKTFKGYAKPFMPKCEHYFSPSFTMYGKNNEQN